MSFPEISVVVPVYKVENYIRRCIDSVRVQTFTDFELLLIDDGSPDGCYEICESYARGDNRIKVFRKENGGLSDARNYGVNKAGGKYITFIDSDDYVSNDYLETLHNLIIENDADIAVGNYETVTDKENSDHKQDVSSPEILVMNSDEALHKLLGSSKYLQMETAWGKLIKTGIVRKHPFPRGRYHEDEATTYLYYLDAAKTVLTSKSIYMYYQNSSSIMHSDRDGKRIEDALWALTERASNLDDLDKKDAAQLAWLFVFGWLYDEVSKHPKERWKYKEIYKKLQNAAYTKDNVKTKSFIYMSFPYIYKSIQKIRGKS